jgi:hypothetical protein
MSIASSCVGNLVSRENEPEIGEQVALTAGGCNGLAIPWRVRRVLSLDNGVYRRVPALLLLPAVLSTLGSTEPVLEMLGFHNPSEKEMVDAGIVSARPGDRLAAFFSTARTEVLDGQTHRVDGCLMMSMG